MKVVKQMVAAVAMLLFGAETMAGAPICELAMSSDAEISVPSGETVEIYVISGGAHTLTKKGAGVLKVADIVSRDVKINLQEGELRIGDRPSRPGVSSAAVLHLDADDETSMDLRTSGEDVLVDVWNDANGGERKASSNKRIAPKLVRGYRNGLNVVDFGSIKNNNQDDGYGASMAFDERITGLRETFSVMMYTEDVYPKNGQATPVFGQSGQAAFLAFGMSGNDWPYFFLYSNPNTKQAQGGLYVNGVNVADNTRASGGLELVSFRLSAPEVDASDLALADGLAFDRSFAWGGQRIGECMLFTRSLTDDERKEVNTYLNVKWFPSGSWSVSQIVVGEGARLTLSGNSSVSAADISVESGDFVVDGATVTVDPLTTRESWFHVDANKVDSADMEDGHLLKWRDVGGNGRYATHSTLKPEWRSDPDNRKPILRSAYLNGNAVVDFGALQTAQIVDLAGVGIGYGAAMKWSEMCTNVREVLMVVSDTEDIATVKAAYPNVVSPTPFVGNSSSSGNQFYRPSFGVAGTYPGVILNYNPNTQHVWGYEHGVAIDGVNVPASTSMGAGFHLVNFRSAQDAKADYFAYDRGLGFGGLRYGEFMLFDRELGTAERNRLTGALMAKWLGREGYGQAYGNVSVAAGSELRVPYAKLNVAGTLRLEGKIVAKSVRASVIEVSPDAIIDGELDLTKPGVLKLTLEAYGTRLPGERFLVLAADAVSGNLKRWKIEGDLAKDNQKVVLFAGDDGLYAEVQPKKGLHIKLL